MEKPVKFIDLQDRKFGRLTALFPLDEKAANGETLWFCECECGGTKAVKSSHLRGGNTQSCGCIRNKKIAGQKFGKLTAIKSFRRPDDNRMVWTCQCKCGNTIDVVTADLLNGSVKSCGCLGSIKTKHRKVKSYNKKCISDFVGKRFNSFVVLKPTKKRYYEDVVWKCKCDCGKTFEAPTSNIMNGRIKSCGCRLQESNNTFGIRVKKTNRYIFNKIGIGYTLKGEKFYFDKEDFSKIKDYCWRTDQYKQFISYNPKTWPERKSVIACWRVILDEYNMTKKVTYKNGNKWDLRKNNLEVI